MDPVRNPYSPGAGIRPRSLVGRETQIESFQIAVQRLDQGRYAKSQILTGLRGVGKTVLLAEFGHIATEHAWVHQHIEATEDTNLAGDMAKVIRRAALELSLKDRAAEPFTRMLATLKSFGIRYKLPDNLGEIQLGVEPAVGIADSGDLQDDLSDLLSALGELALSKQRGVLITIDEVQYLDSDNLAALIVALHLLSQRRHPLPIMVAAAGLPSIPALAGEAKSYAERLFNYVAIGSLDEETTGQALVGPALEEGVVWDPPAVQEVCALTDGYPYFVQMFGSQAWKVAEDDRITPADIEAAAVIAQEELDSGFFKSRVGRVADKERDYLRAMATLGPGTHKSAGVAKILKRKTSDVGVVRDRLIKKGLIYAPRHGDIAFTVPMFDEFMKRWMPDPAA